jgi:hypothetical protein
MMFSVASRFASLSADRLLHLVVPDAATLAVVIEAAIALAHEADGQGGAASSRIGQALRKLLTPLAFDQVVGIGRTLDGEDVVRLAHGWLRAADLTAARAALVVSGDLRAALRQLRDDPGAHADTAERLLDVIWFSVTDVYKTLRARVNVQKAPAVPALAMAG